MLAAARVLPSGVNEREVIAPVHPSNVFTRFADVTSYTAIKCLSPSFPEMATVLPSGEKAYADHPFSEKSVFRSGPSMLLPVVASHLRSLVRDAPMSTFPSGEKATASTPSESGRVCDFPSTGFQMTTSSGATSGVRTAASSLLSGAKATLTAHFLVSSARTTLPVCTSHSLTASKSCSPPLIPVPVATSLLSREKARARTSKKGDFSLCLILPVSAFHRTSQENQSSPSNLPLAGAATVLPSGDRATPAIVE